MQLTAELAAEVRRRQEAEERVKVIQQQLAEVASHQTAALDSTRRALETEKQLCDQLKKYEIALNARFKIIHGHQC